MSTQIPSRVIGGRYRLQAALGRGGMGTVWSAVDEMLDRRVAVKEITPPSELDDLQRSQLRARTLREARAAARIDSPAAVTVYDVVEEDGRPWIVMQLVQAPTLADVIRQRGPLPDREVARIGLRVLDALSAAHRAGVLHRDVKPANVLVPDNGSAVLSDFGIASLEGDASMTTTGMIVGSPAYMAPERARGAAPSPASDLWSLGATLAAAVQGRSPFEREGQIPTLMAVLHDDPSPLPTGGPLAAAIAGLLRKDPAERMRAGTARALLAEAADAPGATVAGAGAPPRRQLEHTQPVPVLPDTAIVTHGAPLRASPAAAHRAAPARAPQSAPPVATAYQSGRGRQWTAVILALVLVGAGAAVAYALWPKNHGGTGAGAAPATTRASGSRSASGSPSHSASASPSGGGASASGGPSSPAASGGSAVAPAGFTSYDAPGAFRIDVPKGWAPVTNGAQTDFKQPGGRSFLRVERGGVPNGDPLTDWQNQEPIVQSRLAGYQRVKLVRVPYKTFSAADWEFTWQPSGGQLHVLDRNVVVKGSRAYAVYWSVPEEEWAASQPTLQHILDSFAPIG
jgi:tRNA A-37 threonylcarbamoyl transferase component Bud32